MNQPYHVPPTHSPYRWRVVLRIIVTLCACYPLGFFIISKKLAPYFTDQALGVTFGQYVALDPDFWTVFPLTFALACFVIGLVGDLRLLIKRRSSSTLLPIPYRLALLLIGLAGMLNLTNEIRSMCVQRGWHNLRLCRACDSVFP
ncbi:hypothetical protein JOD20_002059 [Herpetosiphon giganteus]|nr:hypothetical protein [Herpetosiphon giganteus]